MAWTTNQVSQNGNSTVTWTISGGALSTHDAVVPGPTSGSSGLRLENVTVRRDPTRYAARTTVVGAGAMSLRFYAEQMD